MKTKTLLFLLPFTIFLSGICLKAGKTNSLSTSIEIVQEEIIVQQDVPEPINEFRILPNVILF